jgi:hypothetical protein
MTAILILLALAIVVDVIVTMRALRHDRPAEAPVSHRGWGDSRFPSQPYSAGI